MNRDRILKIAIGITAILLIVIAWLMEEDGFSSVAKPGRGLVYQIFAEEKIPREKADELLAADGSVYLYYEDFGLVNVYTTEGAYQWSYQVAPGKNGVGGIGYADGIFYLRSRSNGVFAFKGTELASADVPNEDEIVDEPNPVTDSGYTYYYNAEANQINRAKPGEALETVVQLPQMNPVVLPLFAVIGAVWVAVAVWDQKERVQ
ncbi:MAG: PQQ-like beta-propeller repeat protein [Ruminococcaceae bacterium]|nr:PQQ-like beta-propeller repeat protein [Oscillospiraceae bacterium]